MLVTFFEYQITSMASDYHLGTFFCTCWVMYDKELAINAVVIQPINIKEQSFSNSYTFAPRIPLSVFMF